MYILMRRLIIELEKKYLNLNKKSFILLIIRCKIRHITENIIVTKVKWHDLLITIIQIMHISLIFFQVKGLQNIEDRNWLNRNWFGVKIISH